jgi:4-hydroxybenzoate polyprenyltransferase
MLKTLTVVCRLTRLDASLLFFGSVFVPLLARTTNLTYSLKASLPVLFVFFCIYLIDHVEDFSGDLINHPDRPLPSGQITVPAAVLAYFLFLFTALISTHLYAPSRSYLYYALLILGINYNQVAEHLPNIKSVYVALVSVLPLLILQGSLPKVAGLSPAICAMFLFTLGKELCMDFRDRKGDPESFVHQMPSTSLGYIAFSLQLMSLLLLVRLTETLADAFALAALASLFVPSIRLWFFVENYRKTITIMKVQLLGGLYYLL